MVTVERIDLSKLKYPDINILEGIVKDSESYSQVLRKLGRKVSGSNHTHLKSKLISLEISTEHFKSNFGVFSVSNLPKSSDDILIVKPEGSKRTPRTQLFRSMLEKDIQYICSICESNPTWNGKPLTLEIDHIDGNYLNNTLENLRFLCPNCHSQQETSFKSKSINPNSMCECGSKKYKTSKNCSNCVKRVDKINWPTIDDLVNSVKKSNLTVVGYNLGVSANAVKKHLVRELGSVAQMVERLAEN